MDQLGKLQHTYLLSALALLLYMAVFISFLSDADLLHPGQAFDLAFLKETFDIPGGNVLSPIFGFSVPLAAFYFFAPLFILLLHFCMLISIKSDTPPIPRYLISPLMLLPTFLLIILLWKFAPYGAVVGYTPSSRVPFVIYDMIHALVLVLDISVLSGMLLFTKSASGQLKTSAIHVHGASLVFLLCITLGLLGKSILQLKLTPAGDMIWRVAPTAKEDITLAFLLTMALTSFIWSCTLVVEISKMLGVTLLSTVGALALTLVGQAPRPLDLSGATLVRVAPEEISIATIAAGIYTSRSGDPSNGDATDAAAEAVADATRAAIVGFGRGFNLNGYHLNGARFVGGRFDMAQFDGASLEYADFTRASLVGASFQQTRLKSARFAQADMTGTTLRPVILDQDNVPEPGANPPDDYEAARRFCQTLLTDANKQQGTAAEESAGGDIQLFDEHDSIRGISIELSGAILKIVDFKNADLRCADLSNAQIRGGAELNGADMRFALLRNTTIRERTLLKNVRLNGANLSEAQLAGADLENASLNGALFFGANLSGAIMKGATLGGANFCGANLADVDLRDANFDGGCPNFEFANLIGTKIKCSQLKDCKMKQAQWRHLQLENCKDVTLEEWAAPDATLEPLQWTSEGAIDKCVGGNRNAPTQ